MSESKLPTEIYYWQNDSRPRPYAALQHMKSGIRSRWWAQGRVYVAKIVEWVDVTDEIVDENGKLK